MSQLEIDRVLAQIRAISAQTGAGAARATRPEESGPSQFATLLRQGLDQVNAAQQRAGELAAAFERGVPGVELPQVMVEMQKASVSFRAVVEVRNRLVNAYQEIMNMPI
ncbi:MAG: flagellar hook-basal body complex protein FliE [Pseudomonadota bacterium]|jgi:flagellar hook-basal body complex protein FliE|nr:MAG: flagellar hook-basal body complex protein FliE [Pseudomonadota bacterium]